MNKLTQSSLALSLFLFACTPSTPSVAPQDSLQGTTETLASKKNLQKIPISFKLEPGFSTQANVQAAFVHLVIEGKDNNGDPHSIYAFGADEETGFVAVSGNTVALSAEVPEGEFWTVTAGFYSNASEGGKIFERMAAFSTVGRTGDSPPVEINALSHPVGQIIKKLYEINSNAFMPVLNLSINGIQGFINGLVGAPNMSRLNELDNGKPIPASPKDTFDLDTTKMALQIDSQNTLYPYTSLNETLGIGLDPKDYRRAPYVQASYSLEPFTDGLREAMALNTSTGNFFFTDSRGSGVGGQTISADEVLYGVNYNNGAFTELFKTSVGNVKSLHVSLGLANSNGTTTKNAIYLTKDTGTGLELLAYDQSNGSKLWGFNFNGARSTAAKEFTPVAFRNAGHCEGCAIDDFDYVYAAFNFDNTFANPSDSGDTVNNGTGIYKLYSVGDDALIPGNDFSNNFGTSRIAARYAYTGSGGAKKDAATFSSTGALSKDGTKLYVVSEGNFSASLLPELIVINTSDMSEIAKVSLSPYFVRSKSAPVIGADGTVYLAVFGNSPQAGSSLMAFNPDGSAKWTLSIDTDDTDEPDYPPVVDYISGKNQIYLHINDNGKVVSVRDNGSSGSISWTQTIGFELRNSPLLAELTSSSKYLYLGTTETGQGISLNASDGSINWSSTLEGSFASGFNFYDGHLFVATKDGNDHSDIRLRAVKTDARRLTQTAPWPKFGGTENNAGVAKLENS